MHKRINISLPEETLGLIDHVAKKRERSSLIDRAIRYYIADTGSANLRKKLKEGYQRRADRDLDIAEAWFALDNEVWSESAR